MQKKEFPYLNRSLKNIKGEQWEDIPEADGYYQVSNFGRLKRMKRKTITKKGSVIIYKEMIIAPRVMKSFNTYISDITYQLSAHFTIETKKYHIPVRRLVYYCFVKPFDLKDSSINIVSRKGNGLDIRPDNLMVITNKDRWKRVIDKKRVVLEFRTPDVHLKGMLVSLKSTCKQVSQYNRSGRRIKTFPSTMEARRQTGINHTHIANAATGREQTAGGHFWAYGNSKRFDVASFLEKRRISFKEKKGTKVTQYDLRGNRIAKYLTLTDAASAVGAKSYTSISAVIRGISRTAFGYVWKAGWGKSKINTKRPLKTKK